MYKRKFTVGNIANKIKILIIFCLLLSDVLDDRLHDLLPAISFHRVNVLHNLRGETQTAIDHSSSLHPVQRIILRNELVCK